MLFNPTSYWGLSLLLGATSLALGCRPDSVTEARDQLARGEPRVLSLVVPISDTAYSVVEFLKDEHTVTTADGLVGVRLKDQEVTVTVGDELRFEDISFDEFAFAYQQMLRTPPVTSSLSFSTQPFPALLAVPDDTLRFATSQGSRVLGGTVDSGLVVRTVENLTACAATVSTALTDSLGQSVASFAGDPAAIGAGQTRADTVDLAGRAWQGFLVVQPTVDFGGCVPAAGSALGLGLTVSALEFSSVSLRQINESFSEDYDFLASESRLQAVDTVAVAEGEFRVTVANRLPVSVEVSLTLNGITRNATPLSAETVVPPAPGDGSLAEAVLTLPLDGTVLVPAQAVTRVDGVAFGTEAQVSPLVTNRAVTIQGEGRIEVERMAGELDPVETPELIVQVEDSTDFDRTDFDFDEFENAIKGSGLNQVPATLVFTNGADVNIALDSMVIGAVRVTPTGMLRDANGDLLFETDAAGDPILVPVEAVPGTGTVLVPRGGAAPGTQTVELNIAPVVDRLVDLALEGETVALAAVGQAVVGDGSSATVSAIDDIGLLMDLVVSLDLTLPDSGVVITVSEVLDGAKLDSLDVDQIAERVSVTAVSFTVNLTPFALTVELALVEDEVDGAVVDIFQLPNRVDLSAVELPAPEVGPDGRVTGASEAEVSVELSGEESRVVLGELFTAGIRLRLKPGKGGLGRGAIRAVDRVRVKARAEVDVTSGGSP